MLTDFSEGYYSSSSGLEVNHDASGASETFAAPRYTSSRPSHKSNYTRPEKSTDSVTTDGGFTLQ